MPFSKSPSSTLLSPSLIISSPFLYIYLFLFYLLLCTKEGNNGHTINCVDAFIVSSPLLSLFSLDSKSKQIMTKRMLFHSYPSYVMFKKGLNMSTNKNDDFWEEVDESNSKSNSKDGIIRKQKQPHTPLRESNIASKLSLTRTKNSLANILNQHKLDNDIVHVIIDDVDNDISSSLVLRPPFVTETYFSGISKTCVVIGFVPSSSVVADAKAKVKTKIQANDDYEDDEWCTLSVDATPLVQIVPFESYILQKTVEEIQLVDLGQLTSVWTDLYLHEDEERGRGDDDQIKGIKEFRFLNKMKEEEEVEIEKEREKTRTNNNYLIKDISTAQHLLANQIIPGTIENIMEELYQKFATEKKMLMNNNYKKKKNGKKIQNMILSKKDIPKIVSQLVTVKVSTMKTEAERIDFYEKKSGEKAYTLRIGNVLRNAIAAAKITIMRPPDVTNRLDSNRGVTSNATTTPIIINNDTNNAHKMHHLAKRLIASRTAGRETVLGGRFKRHPCVFVDAKYRYRCRNKSSNSSHNQSRGNIDGIINDDNNDDGTEKEIEVEVEVGYVSFLNGGWTTVADSGVRMGVEGMKFAERVKVFEEETSCGDNYCGGVSGGGDDTVVVDIRFLTTADERVARNLERFALGCGNGGGDNDSDDHNKNGNDNDGQQQQPGPDVKQALLTLDLPVTSRGARDALVRIGRWSSSYNENSNGDNADGFRRTDGRIVPWDTKVLEASKDLEQFENARNRLLSLRSKASGALDAKQKQKQHPLDDDLEGRIDLTDIPCVCVDAKRASFRDDAIGIRLRPRDCRSSIDNKWEVLVHVTDVSDVYVPEPTTSFATGITSSSQRTTKSLLPPLYDPSPLMRAAEGRGSSRYDLPTGPLHLMPPRALRALSLQTKKRVSGSGNGSNGGGGDNKVRDNKDDKISAESSTPSTVNRCVTLWAYIDGTNGNVIDSGFDRTLVSAPIALSFDEANILLDNGTIDGLSSNDSRTAAAMLTVAERLLSMWSKKRLQEDENARKREGRHRTREAVSRELFSSSDDGNMNDPNYDADGVGGRFRRTKSHLIVDAALDLHGFELSRLLAATGKEKGERKVVPVPWFPGSGGSNRGGRMGTAPLRRIVDCLVQRQALSVLCGYGGPSMSKEECRDAGLSAARAVERTSPLSNGSTEYLAVGKGKFDGEKKTRVEALRSLVSHIIAVDGIGGKYKDDDGVLGEGRDRDENGVGGRVAWSQKQQLWRRKGHTIVPAIGTGRGNEIVIIGNGATARCMGAKTIGAGEQILVDVKKLHPAHDLLNVTLVLNTGL